MPFVTVLRARGGRITDCVVNSPPAPLHLPSLPGQNPGAATPEAKLLDALHQALASATPPLIISAMTTQPEPAPAQAPEPAPVKVETAAPVTVAVTNPSALPKPPQPRTPAVAIATNAPPVSPDKPLTEPPTKPEIATAPGAEPAPPKPQPPAIEAPKPPPSPVTHDVAPAPGTNATGTVTAPARPSAAPAPPAQTATSLPHQTPASRKPLLLAALALAFLVGVCAFLWLRRSRTPPSGSLITRSFERERSRSPPGVPSHGGRVRLVHGWGVSLPWGQTGLRQQVKGVA